MYQGGPLARTQAGVNNGRRKKIDHGNEAPWAIYSKHRLEIPAIGRDCCKRECAHGGWKKAELIQIGGDPWGGPDLN